MNHSPTSDFMEDIGETVGYAEAIIDRKVKIAKLNAAEHIAQLTSAMVTGVIMTGFLFLVLCMFSLALGFALTEYWGWSYATSFLVLTGGYTVTSIILYLLRHQLFTNPVIEIVLSKIYKADNL